MDTTDRTANVLSMVSRSVDRTDRFFRQVLGRGPEEPIDARDSGEAFEVRVGGRVAASIPRKDLHVAKWDQRRFEALSKRISTNWSIYETLSSALAWLRPDERRRVLAQVASRRADLHNNFNELLSLVDRTVGVSLSAYFPAKNT